MFKVGELVTGTEDSCYSYTSKRSLCIVTRTYDEDTMEVLIVCHATGRSYQGDVETKFFEYCTYDEFMKRCPEARLVSSYSEEYLRSVINDGATPEKKEPRIAKEKFGEYELTTEERETLRKEIMELLQEYDYEPTEEGVDSILDEWVNNKGWMINMFKNHPNYNGKYQIVFDTDYDRVVNRKAISHFANWVNDNRREVLQEYKISPFSYREIREILNRLNNILSGMTRLGCHGHNTVLLDGKDYMYYYTEQERFKSIQKRYDGKYCVGECYEYEGNYYTPESRNMIDNINRFASMIVNHTEHIADETFAARVNNIFPTIKAVAAQRVTRIVGKVTKLTGLDKLGDYNKEFAKYCDAINPLTIKRFTVVSCHPVDYLTMSFGNSWSSCHTIDKNNKRNMENGYQGQYSSGTLSYALDSSSFIFYTVDKGYTGNMLELQPKINRNMFHMGEDKLIQARVYPQTTDSEEGFYKQIREIAQKVIADCAGTPNLWRNVKGVDECKYRITSVGTHYKDYLHFSNCNVSYLKSDEADDYINRVKIVVGHSPICPKCGDEHDWQSSIECEHCYNDDVTCVHCGERHDRDEMQLIDGNWYCRDCAFYCEYHNEWEIGRECFYIDNFHYGSYVCEEALDNGEFRQCEACGDWRYTANDSGITAEDGKFFCDSMCASHEGYRCTTSREWYPREEVYHCSECGANVHVSDWDETRECCVACAGHELEEREAI